MNQDHSTIAVPTTEIFEELFAELEQTRRNKMVFLEKHAQEVFWLRRRIQLIELLDKMIDADEDPEQVELYAKQFDKVKEPQDVVNRLKDIYGNDIQ